MLALETGYFYKCHYSRLKIEFAHYFFLNFLSDAIENDVLPVEIDPVYDCSFGWDGLVAAIGFGTFIHLREYS